MCPQHPLVPAYVWFSQLPWQADKLSAQQVTPIQVNPNVPPEDSPRLESLDHVPLYLAQPVEDLLSQLDRSVMMRVRGIPCRS